MQDERFLTRASREQRNALKRDLEPVVRIYNQLCAMPVRPSVFQLRVAIPRLCVTTR